MYAPVLVIPPALMPVSLDEAKLHLKVENNAEDGLIQGLIAAAVSHLDGRIGVLGRALVEQTWRQDFDGFGGRMCLSPGPVSEIVSITWRDVDGQVSTVSDADYSLQADRSGSAYVEWDTNYSSPSNLHETAPVSVTFKAGYPTVPAVEADPEADPPVEAAAAISTVPAALKAAILLMVGNWHRFRSDGAESGVSSLPMGVSSLISPYMRWGN